jgi:hypothetical protein
VAAVVGVSQDSISLWEKAERSNTISRNPSAPRPDQRLTIPTASRQEIFALSTNLDRRDLSKGDRIRIGLRLRKLEAARARERRGTRTDLPPKLGGKLPEGESTELAASKAGVAPETLRKAAAVERASEAGTPGGFAQTWSGEPRWG